MGAEDAYKEGIENIKSLNPTPNTIFDAFLAEKSLDIDRVLLLNINYIFSSKKDQIFRKSEI